MIPEADFEDGYPTEEFLNALDCADVNYEEAKKILTEYLPSWCENISCCWIKISDKPNSNVKKIEFSTGGWSGAEDLISILLKKIYIQMFYAAWQRGGHFTFEVPV